MILTLLKNNFWKFSYHVDRCIAHILIWLIVHSRPLFGPSKICPFPLGCTEFAVQQLQNHWFGYATVNIVIRLLWCNPIGLRIRKS